MDDIRRGTDFFPADYWDARDRFCLLAEGLGAECIRYPISAADDLSIDVAVFGHPGETALVVSSGVHGVEGPFGSAVQLAELDRFRDQPPRVRTVFIHAINPFGYAFDRRWNEDNVDLNRNFFAVDHAPIECPPMYVRLNSFLNPSTVPSRWEPFGLISAGYVLRYGMSALKEAVASGQYEYPSGLFFGGTEPCQSTRIIQQHYHDWIGDSRRVVHLDLHTSLGEYGQCKLLLELPLGDRSMVWFERTCGPGLVESSSTNATAYQARGSMGSWITAAFSDRELFFATVELGTHGLLRVLSALRDENRVYHHADDPNSFAEVRAELRECFCPTDPRWRNQVVGATLEIIQRCAAAL